MKRFLAVGGVILVIALVLWIALPGGSGSDRQRRDDRETEPQSQGRALRWGGGDPDRDFDDTAAPGVEGETIQVRGRVVDAIDGSPIPGALVSLRTAGGDELDQSSSDEEGAFRFERAPASASVVAASAPGYALQARRLPPDAEVLLELDGSVTVAGVVVSPEGEPVAGAEVWVEDRERQWRSPPAVSQSVSSDSEGRFVVEDAPSGTLVVHATHARFAPGEAEIGTAGPGREKSGTRVVLAEAGTLRGTVRDGGGAAVAGARVEWHELGRYGWVRVERSTETDAEGRFELTNVPPGDGEVYARSRGLGDAVDEASVEARQVTEVDLTLAEIPPVSGIVLGPSGAPVAGAHIRRIVWRSGAPRDAPEAVSDADGRFTIDVPSSEEDSTLLATSEGLRGRRRVSAGETDVTILLRESGVLRFRLVRADGSRFRGRAVIQAIHPKRTTYCNLEEYDSTTGEGVISGPPGDWKISFAYVEADFEPVDDVVVHVPASPPETSMELRVESVPEVLDGRVRGRLAGPGGEPVPGARVSLARSNEDAGRRLDWRAAVRSDATGRFTLDAPSGPGRLFVYHPEFKTELLNVNVPAGGEWDAGTIRLVPGAGASAVFEFTGIGAVLSFDDSSRCVIREVLAGAPAESSGIRAGDVVLEIDGVLTEGLSLGDIVERIRGPAGSTVRLRLERPGNLEPFTVDVVRDQVRA